MIEHIIQDKKVQIHDDVLSERLVSNWINFYENSATFTLSAFEDKNKKNSMVYFMQPLSLKHRVEVFEIDSWLGAYLENFNPLCNMTHFNRSYLNLMTKCDVPEGHSDTLSNDSFYVSCLIFLNPYVEDDDDCGFHIEDLYIQNKFNRMIIFDGTLFHKAKPPITDIVRLTGYFGFSGSKTRNSFNKELSFLSNNQWFKRNKT